MSIQDLGSIGELVAAVATLATLIYLARQIRQSNSLARAHTRERMVEQASNEVYKGFVENPDILRSLFKEEPLSETDWIQLTGWLLSAMRQREYEYFQMKDGNIEKEIWEAYSGVMTIHLGTKRTRKWWEWAKTPFDTEFCAEVDKILDSRADPRYFDGLKQLVADQDPGP